ncbi:MAG: MATE family efflux transporter [Clostridia bacterium]|nr:MATE family efflux transporter [Clostridia bacterium]
MRIQLSDHFTYRKLLRFTLPSIIMMIFTSIYGVVDGFFVSNFVGKTPFAAVNFIFPTLMVLGAVGSMLGSGGSALVAKTLGEGDIPKAKRLFSLFVYLTVGIGTVLAVFGIAFLRPIAMWLGATEAMLDDCVLYGRIILCAMPFQMLQFEFQSFFVTAEKPQLGLYVTLGAGVTNMVLDALLVAVFPLGLVGAALATALSQLVGGAVPIVYFARHNDSLLRLTATRYDGKAVRQAAANGSSEFLSNVSMSMVSMLYNAQLIAYAGENGVAAYGTMMYVSFVFVAIFIGYSVGTAPVIGYHYGAQNHGELRSILKKSLVIVGIASVGMLIASEALAMPLSRLFVGYDRELYDLTLRGFIIFSFSFVFSGLPIFGSSFFTALNNGPVSALISFLRTVVFQVAAVLLLPLVWGIDGVWISLVVAEAAAALTAVICWLANKRKYQY